MTVGAISRANQAVVKVENEKLSSVNVASGAGSRKVIRWWLVTIDTILSAKLTVVEENGRKILRIHMTYRARRRKMFRRGFMAVSAVPRANRTVIKRNHLPTLRYMAGATQCPIGSLMRIILRMTGITGRISALINAAYMTGQAI